MDDIKRLRTFLNVVDSGSFSGAARDVASVSAITRQVKSLEDELGARLMNRNSRRLSLTEAGQRLYERGKLIITELEQVKSEVVSMQEEVRGVLRVAMRTAAGMVLVVPALPRLLRDYPDLEVDIILTDERLDFIAQKIDVQIWMGDLPDSDLIARLLSRTNRRLCASPDYLDRHGTPLHPSDLAVHDCLRFTARSYGPNWTFRRGPESVEVAVNGPIRANNGLVLLDAAVNGLGFVSLPEWMARSPLHAKQLVRVLPDWEVDPVGTHAEHFAVFPSSRGLSRKVRVFVDFLVTVFSESHTSS